MSIINMIGKPCPLPVIAAKKSLKKIDGNQVQLLVDNDIARQNLEKMATGLGHSFEYETNQDGHILISIMPNAAACRLAGDTSGGLVVAIGRETMGAGSDELGLMLMKSFIHSLTELDTPPEHILLFNGGVRLSTEGSSAIDDLNTLMTNGASVASCGACLNYYGLSDKLEVGSVTNMYAIAETMSQAFKLINM